MNRTLLHESIITHGQVSFARGGGNGVQNMNRQLAAQNFELERQKDSLIMSKQFLEDRVFNQSHELRIQDNTIVSLSNLVSPRCYKEPMTPEEAFRIIEESSGAHFDQDLAQMFLDSRDAVIAIMNKYQ